MTAEHSAYERLAFLPATLTVVIFTRNAVTVPRWAPIVQSSLGIK